LPVKQKLSRIYPGFKYRSSAFQPAGNTNSRAVHELKFVEIGFGSSLASGTNILTRPDAVWFRRFCDQPL
jgi:hypothetical protein